MTFPKAAAELLPPGLEDFNSGLTLAVTLNLLASDDEVSTSMTEVSDSQTADGGGDLNTKMRKDFAKKQLQNFVIQIGFSIEFFCVSHSFLMWNWMTETLGIQIFPGHRFLAFKPGVCTGTVIPSTQVSIKVTEELDVYEGGFISQMYCLNTKKTVLRESEFEITFWPVSTDIVAISSSSLTRTTDTWLVNPYGVLPKVAMLFPNT